MAKYFFDIIYHGFRKRDRQDANNTERFSYFIQLTHKNTNLLQNNRHTVECFFNVWFYFRFQSSLILRVFSSSCSLTMGIIQYANYFFLPSSDRFKSVLDPTNTNHSTLLLWISTTLTRNWQNHHTMAAVFWRALAKSTLNLPLERRVFIL